jgi:hypothetical protein
MATDIGSVIVQDPDIHSGDPVFRVRVFLSKFFLTTSKAEKLWTNF